MTTTAELSVLWDECFENESYEPEPYAQETSGTFDDKLKELMSTSFGTPEPGGAPFNFSLLSPSTPPPSNPDIHKYFDTLFLADSIVEFRLIAPHKNLPPWRNHFLVSDVILHEYNARDIRNQLAHKNREGYNIYCTLNGYIDGQRVCHVLALDVDDCTEQELQSGLTKSGLPKPTLILSSGGGMWAFWRLNKRLTEEEFKSYQQSLIAYCQPFFGGKVDNKICDAARITRVPAYRNWGKPKNPYPDKPLAKVISANKSYVYTISDFCFKLNEPVKMPSKPKSSAPSNLVLQTDKPQHFFGEKELKKVEECLSRLKQERCDQYSSWWEVGACIHSVNSGKQGFELWDAWSQKTTRSNYGYQDCVKFWNDYNADKGLTLGTLIRWAREDSGDPDFLVREVGKDDPPKCDGGIEFKSAQEYSKMEIKDEQNYLWEGRLIPGQLALFSGYPKDGKSTFFDTILYHMLNNVPFLGKMNAPNKILYMNEMSKPLIKERLAISELNEENLIIVRRDAKRSKTDFLHYIDRMNDQRNLAEFGLIVLDSLTNWVRFENENSNDEIGTFITTLRLRVQKYSPAAAVCIIHHCGKRGNVKNEVSAIERIRGGSAFVQEPDVLMVLERADPKSPTCRQRVFHTSGRQQVANPVVLVELGAVRYQPVNVGCPPQEIGTCDGILSILQEEDGLTLEQIANKWKGACSSMTVWRKNEKLIAEKKVIKHGAGTKKNPYKYFLFSKLV